MKNDMVSGRRNTTHSTRPLVALPADTLLFEGYQWHAAPQQYLTAVDDVSNVTPIIIPSLGQQSDIQSLIAIVDGILITGATSNVQPDLYGHAPDSHYGPFDPARDESSMKLIRFALKFGIPLLAICRGMQELNVVLGGTLAHNIQDLPNRDDHRAPQTDNGDEKFALRQKVKIAEASRLAALIGAGEVLVNSVHQQAVDRLADGLTIEAQAHDGTIKAVSVKGAESFAFGFQWHPEYWAKIDKPSRKIFEAFGQAVYYHQRLREEKNLR